MDTTTLLVVIAAEFILVTSSLLIVIFWLVPDLADASDAAIEGENTRLASATTDPWIAYSGYYPAAAMMGFMPGVYIPSHYHSAPAPAATVKVSEVATAKPSPILAESVS